MRLNKWVLGSATVVLVAMASAATFKVSTSGAARATVLDSIRGRFDATVNTLGLRKIANGSDSGYESPATAPGSDLAEQATYIVIFKESALGTYRGEIAGLAAPKRALSKSGKLRLDVKSDQSRKYVDFLQRRQSQHESRLSNAIGRGLNVRMRMQHAVNGIVTDMTRDEAARIAGMSDVRLVEAYREIPMDTDTGPLLIGAGEVWDGTATGSPYQGEGVVFGIIDSGINFGSPSFAAVDPVDGYQHLNPLGAGNYLGTCTVGGGIDEGRCNAKLIGGYDFVCGPPANLCGAADIREEPGFGDTSGHGSHTASTAAGNRRDAEFRGLTRRISGVAPRGNIIAYDVCYTRLSDNAGLCPNVSSVAAINRALVDGIVDVFNYSIGGGAQPWTDAVSLAFLGASNAGIYVSASAGNSGPGANTLGHVEPWVSSTAAAQHGRGAFSFLMQVTGPTPIPPSLTAIIVNPGVNGVPHTAAIPGTTPMVVSPTFSTTTDGCAAFAANAFQDAIAVVRRGGCAFADKTNNAEAAGAIAIVIANSAAGALIPSVPGTTIRAFGVEQADGTALADFYAANPTATAMIGFPAVALPNVADALAAFSSRGPAGTFNLLKPDVTAPGVLVLAAYAGDTITGFENLVETISGTSMASPHQAGAAGLIRQARPTWTVPEIKSALMMTAKQEVFLEDQVTQANPFARGAGRIQVDRAINAGLVMDESAANYLAADPANGGDPSTLNQPSLANRNCASPCSFTRTFRNTTANAQLWEVQFGGGLKKVNNLQPLLLRVPARGSLTTTFAIDVSAIPVNGVWNFGTVSLLPLRSNKGGPLTALHLPVAIALQAPVIVIPDIVSTSVAAGTTGSGTTTVANQGGGALSWTVDNTGTGIGTFYEAARGPVNSGFRSVSYADPATAGNNAQFAGDDFMLGGSTRISALSAEGFVVSGAALATVATNISWSIFPDAGGLPAGDPERTPGSAVWSYTAAPTAAGVSTDGGTIRLDLDAAGQNVVLPAGKYWFVVRTRSTFANRWAWFASNDGDGSFATINVSTANAGAWAANTAFAGLSMRVTAEVGCGAPWLGAFSPNVGVIAPGGMTTVSFNVNAAALTAGNYRGIYCISSNDPAKPKVAGRISLLVN